MMNTLALAAGLMLSGISGCSHPKAKPDPKPDEIESSHKMVNPLVDDTDDGDGMKVEGTLGTLDQSAVEAGMGRPMLEITSCFDREQRTRPYLGGKAVLQFRVTREGKVKTVQLQESTLGLNEVNRCILDAARGATFARPRGGEAEFGYTVEFQGRVVPTAWDPGMVREELEKNREKLLTVKQGRKKETLVPPSGLTLTMYVDRRGKMVAVGMTALEEIDEEFAAHFVAELEKIQFETPDGPYAKVTITW